MPIFDWRNNEKLKPGCPWQIIDASGSDRTERIFWLDSDTGEAMAYATDENGLVLITDNYELASYRLSIPLPIRLIPSAGMA